jgi:hypothetical protein
VEKLEQQIVKSGVIKPCEGNQGLIIARIECRTSQETGATTSQETGATNSQKWRDQTL